MTKLIAFVLAASLCIGSASAVDIYEVDQDARPLMMMANSGISTAAVDDDWYYLLLQNIEWMMYDIDSIQDLVDSIYLDTGDMCEFLFKIVDVLGTDMDGTIAGMLSSSLKYLGDTAGWLGVYDGGPSLASLLGSISANSSTSNVHLYNIFDLFATFAPKNSMIVGDSGSLITLTEPISFFQFLNNSLRGINNELFVGAGSAVLGSSGSSTTVTGRLTAAQLLRNGFLGLSSNLKEISTGSYQWQIPDYDHISGAPVTPMLAFNASTMGQMLHSHLFNISSDIAALTYMYADSDAIQAKKDSASNSSAVLDGFLKPGSAGSVGVSDIVDAADAVSGTKDLFDTGVSIGQALDQLQGSGPLAFFTAETAANLNTVPAIYSDDDDFVHFYDPNNSEFFKLIGKGS